MPTERVPGGHVRSHPNGDADGKPLRLAVGDVVVYASHGVGSVEERRGPARGLPATVVLACASGMRVTLPLDQARLLLRPLSSERELEDVRRILSMSGSPSSEPWTKRFRELREKVAAGDVTSLAEVVREGLERERGPAGGKPGGRTLGPMERQLYLQARKLLAAEIAVARGIDATEAEAWIDRQRHEHAPT
jgi:RNA polymerase-interacting CarD/CdnL/TRCF family regulator